VEVCDAQREVTVRKATNWGCMKRRVVFFFTCDSPVKNRPFGEFAAGTIGCVKWHKNLRMDEPGLPIAMPLTYVDTAQIGRSATDLSASKKAFM
jgi:hypothetical protein